MSGRDGDVTSWFLLGAWALPLTVAGIVAAGAEGGWGLYLFGIAALGWTVTAAFGGTAYLLLLRRRVRIRGGRPAGWGAFLMGLAFAPLPLLLVPLAEATGGRIDPEKGLLLLPLAGSAVAAAAAWLTPLRLPA